MTPAQRAARVEAEGRGRVFSEAWPAVRRVQKHLLQLGNPRTSRTDRLALWRLISDAALTAWEQEVQQLDSLNFAVCDPNITAVTGGVVE
jgi:hypothetical protein